jgi:hypothetical protein
MVYLICMHDINWHEANYHKLSLNSCNPFVRPVRSEHVYGGRREASTGQCVASPACAATLWIQMLLYTLNNCSQTMRITVRSCSALSSHFIGLCFSFFLLNCCFLELLTGNDLNLCLLIKGLSRSQWPLGLRHELSSPARTLGSWVRIPLETWMSICVR